MRAVVTCQPAQPVCTASAHLHTHRIINQPPTTVLNPDLGGVNLSSSGCGCVAVVSFLLLQLVGQLDDVEEEQDEEEEEEEAAAAAAAATKQQQQHISAQQGAPAATAVTAAAVAAAAVTGCDSDGGSSSRSDGSAVPLRSLPVPVQQRRVDDEEVAAVAKAQRDLLADAPNLQSAAVTDQTQPKLGPHDFDILRVVGQGAFGKVSVEGSCFVWGGRG